MTGARILRNGRGEVRAVVVTYQETFDLAQTRDAVRYRLVTGTGRRHAIASLEFNGIASVTLNLTESVWVGPTLGLGWSRPMGRRQTPAGDKSDPGRPGSISASGREASSGWLPDRRLPITMGG